MKYIELKNRTYIEDGVERTVDYNNLILFDIV